MSSWMGEWDGREGEEGEEEGETRGVAAYTPAQGEGPSKAVSNETSCIPICAVLSARCSRKDREKRLSSVSI